MSKRVALGLGSVLVCSFFLTAKVPIGAPQSRQQSGMASGGAHPAVRDAQHRPITAGGFVDGAPVVFTDLTKPAGLDKFHHRSGSLEKTHIIDTPGSGVALLDYDNNGWLDIYLLNGSSVPALKDTEPAPHAMLLRNNRDGTFSDVTEQSRRRQRALGVWRSRRGLRQ
jgi:enediyne biosynthesis protein E4